MEEEYWRKRARVRWLKEGDKNTKYFNAVTAQRRRVKRIERLESYEGQQIEEKSELGEEITNYFGNRFTTSGPNNGEKTMVGMRRSITDAMNVKLTMPVEKKEITKAIFSMNPHKALSPNGMTFLLLSNILVYY